MIKNIYILFVVGAIAGMPAALFGMDGKTPQKLVPVLPVVAENRELERFREELAKTLPSKDKHNKYLYTSFDENAQVGDGNTKK